MTSGVSRKSSRDSYFQDLDPEMMLDLIQTQFQNIDEKKGLQSASGGGGAAPAGGTAAAPGTTSPTQPAPGTTAAQDTRTAQGARAVNNVASDGMAVGTRDATRPSGETPPAVRRGIERQEVAPVTASTGSNTGATTT